MVKLVYLPANAHAQVVKLVDTQGLGPCAARLGGSNPLLGIGVGRRARMVYLSAEA